MVEPAERELTMEEIVVALRETRRGAGRAPPFSVVGEERSGGIAATDRSAGATDIAQLRDGEIDRLLAENARLNERVMSLLRIIEREPVREARPVAISADAGAIAREVRSAVGAELRPVLNTLLQLLERQHATPAEPANARHGDDGIIDLDAELRA
jgi:hypothetical protein